MTNLPPFDVLPNHTWVEVTESGSARCEVCGNTIGIGITIDPCRPRRASATSRRVGYAYTSGASFSLADRVVPLAMPSFYGPGIMNVDLPGEFTGVDLGVENESND